MSWAMPTAAAAGVWNPAAAMAMAPEMGNYTPEQWAALQQQNWQQWSQWQQQYAQWQTQYGEKYAQQMQAMAAMGGPAPPLPVAAAPAPPPPDQPPPPPPHENNQPLFASTQPAPVPAAYQPITNPVQGYGNAAVSGNNQNQWSHGPPAPSQPTQSAVNSEALKKLAEEERLFDIQFQKWEEEIEKWKRENQNHPDKEAYKEYEAKFEACRVQLLERRQQMNQRRARLLGTPSPAAPAAAPPPHTPAALPPHTPAALPPHTPAVPKPHTPAVPQPHTPVAPQTHTPAKIPPLMQTPVQPPIQANTNRPPQNYNRPQSYDQPPNQYNNNQNQRQQYNNSQNQQYSNTQGQQYKNNPSQQYNNMPNQNYNMSQNDSGVRGKNVNNSCDPQDRYEAYQTMEDYSEPPPSSFDKTSFLPSANATGIPGLDLVPEAEKQPAPEVIDITEDGQSQPAQGPDYTKISKGINNILGDEKIMNILSMVRDQVAPLGSNVQGQNVAPRAGNAPGPRPPPQHSGNSYNNVQQNPANNQWNNQYNNEFNNAPYNRQDSQGMQSSQGPNRMFEGQDMPQDQYYDRNSQYGGQNMGPRPLMSLPNQGRPPLMETPVPQNMMNRGPPMNNGGMHERNMAGNRMPMHQPPPRPAWVEEPLFTPSIIVEYEHKPLRLKAREFIEPVHMFDYNHKSTEDEYKKKDFEKEVDDLFTRKSRFQDENIDRFSRDSSERFVREPMDRFPREPVDRFSRDSMDRFSRELPVDRFSREPAVDRFSREPPADRFLREPVERLARDSVERFPREPLDRFTREPPSRDYERRQGKEDREVDDYRPRLPPEEDFEDRRRIEPSFERRRDDRDRPYRRDEPRRDDYRRDEPRREDHRRDEPRRDDYRREDHRSRDRYRDSRRDEPGMYRRSRDRDTRKRDHSKESELSSHSKKSKEETKVTPPASDQPRNIIMIDDILEPPGREMRPEKIVIILRGPPGSGKSYVAKLIRDREAEHGGAARIMSIDDYFMQEGEVSAPDPATGKMIKKPTLKYEYDESAEETYLNSLKRAFKRSITDGYFNFLIFDANNDQLKSYADIWNYARQNGFQVYVCTMELDPQVCFKRNIHNRKLEDIEVICSRFFPTPAHHLQLDPTTLLQSAAITEVHMEDAEDPPEEAEEPQVETVTSKWEKMDDAAQLARLDGISKPLRPSQLSMEDYLQLDDWTPNQAKPGKKTVRWADIEERRQQEKMRAIGFVVGQTDWNRMTDPTMGSSALTQTKYIERVRRH